VNYQFYITPQEYAQAAEHGVSYALLTRRIRELAWPKELAIITPPRKLTDRREWAAVALQNGVSYKNFMNRVNARGWDEERAAVTPPETPEQRKEHARRGMEANRVIPAEYLARADALGISRNALRYRIRRGMSLEEAVTRPRMTPQERGRQSSRKLRERYGDINAPIFT